MILDVHTHAVTAEQWGQEWEQNWEPVYSEPAHATTVDGSDASWARPADGHRALIQVQEWGVVDKLLFGSDYPVWRPATAIAGVTTLSEVGVPDGASNHAKQTLDWIRKSDPRSALGVDQW